MPKKTIKDVIDEVDSNLNGFADYIIEKMKREILVDVRKILDSTITAQKEEIKILRRTNRKMIRQEEKTGERFNDFVHRHNDIITQKDILVSTLQQRIQQLEMQIEQKKVKE